MPVGTDSDGRDDNEGPHCRNCHVGANNCYVCHSDSNASAVYGTGSNVSAAYTATTTASVSNQTNYASQSFIRQSAVTGVGSQCLDGGFSFPHRTLGANMLKDELFGIDFDGKPIAAGVVRGANTGSLVATTSRTPRCLAGSSLRRPINSVDVMLTSASSPARTAATNSL